MDCSEVKIGDQVFISTLVSDTCRASVVGRWAEVTATGPSWFNADGLSFRKDGTGWNGKSHVRAIIPNEEEATADTLVMRVDRFLRAHNLGRRLSRL